MKGSSDTHRPTVQAILLPSIWLKEIEQAATVLGGSAQTVDCRNSDYVTAFHPDSRIILPCSTFALKKWMVCCNCDFVYRPTVIQLQQKSFPAKSSQILGVGYSNLVSGRKSISVHPYTVLSIAVSHAWLNYTNILLIDIWLTKCSAWVMYVICIIC